MNHRCEGIRIFLLIYQIWMSLPNFHIFRLVVVGFKTYLTPWRVQASLAWCLLAFKLCFNFIDEFCQAEITL